MDDDIVKLIGNPVIIKWIITGLLVLFSVVCVCNKRLNRYLREHRWAVQIAGDPGDADMTDEGSHGDACTAGETLRAFP